MSKYHRIFSIYIPAIAAIVTTMGTMYQISKPQEIYVVSDLKAQEDKKNLESERQALETRIAELERKIDEAKSKPEATAQSTFRADRWFVTALKTWATYFTLSFSAALTVLTFVGDLIGLFFGYSFDLTKALWNFSWSRVTINWYWSRAQWFGVVVGIASIAIVGGIPQLYRKKGNR